MKLPGPHRLVLGRWVGTYRAGGSRAERCQQEADGSGAVMRVLMLVVGEKALWLVVGERLSLKIVQWGLFDTE